MEPAPRRPARTPRWLVALAASAAVHTLLAVGLWLGRPSPAPRRPSPIEFTLVHLPPLPRPGDEGASTAPARATPPAAAATGRSRRAPSGGAVATVPDGPVLPSATASGPGEPSDLVDLSWATPGDTSRSAPPDLSARPSEDVIAFHTPGDANAEARLQRLFREDMGRAKVESGLADPFFLDFGRSVLAAWEPERAVTDRGLSGYAKQLVKSIVEYAGIYAEKAATYGRTGSPFAPGELPLSLAGLAAVPEGLGTRISDQMTAARALSEQSRIRHAALVRVVQRADGRLLSVELLRPSEDSSVDAQALRDLREAAASLPTPTPSALAGRNRVSSVWEFSLVVSITPPLPMITVQFDEVLGLVDARVPLDRRLFKLVRLVSVE